MCTACVGAQWRIIPEDEGRTNEICGLFALLKHCCGNRKCENVNNPAYESIFLLGIKSYTQVICAHLSFSFLFVIQSILLIYLYFSYVVSESRSFVCLAAFIVRQRRHLLRKQNKNGDMFGIYNALWKTLGLASI